MAFEATYDREADIVWFRFPAFNGRSARTEQADWGLRDIDRSTGETVGLEFWRASSRLPDELLEQLPAPKPPVRAGTA